MANWPGKDTNGPHIVSGDKYRYVVYSTMPCDRSVSGTGVAKDVQDSYDKAHVAMDTAVRKHLRSCRKCPANTPRP